MSARRDGSKRVRIKKPSVRVYNPRSRQYRKTGMEVGELKTHQLLAAVVKETGESNPAAQECINILLKISRRDPGYAGRHVGAQLSAVNSILDRLRGRAGTKEPSPPEVNVPQWNFSGVKGVEFKDAFVKDPDVEDDDY